MNFLKKHYEKIILAISLLVFIFSLIWLIAVLSVSLNIKPEDLKLPYIRANYNPLKLADYEIANIFYSEHDWARQNADSEDKLSADLVLPYPAAPCGVCSKIIPYQSWEKEKCPNCGAKLQPPKIKKGPDEDGVTFDTDKDGIPDKVEKEFNLDPNNPTDAFTDLDEDGFNNLTEYKLKTKMNDAKSHPPAALRLYVSKIERRELNLKLQKVVKSGDDKSKWEIQMYVKGKLKFYKIGNVIDYGPNDKFNIVDIVPKTVEVEDKKLKTLVSKDMTGIIIQREDDPPIEIQPEKKVFENKEKIFIIDSATGKEYTPNSSGEFTVTGKNIQPETYVVDGAADAKNKKVKLKNKEGMPFNLGDKTFIAQQEWDKKEIPPPEENPENMMHPEGMPLPPGFTPGPQPPKQPKTPSKTTPVPGPAGMPMPPAPPGVFPGQMPQPPRDRK